MELNIEELKSLPEYKKYLGAKQDFADVCKGGKDFYACSFMGISIRSDRFDEAKNRLVKTIGKIILEKLEKGE